MIYTHAPAIRFRRVSHPSIHFPQSVNFSGMKMGSSWLSRFSAVANQSAREGVSCAQVSKQSVQSREHAHAVLVRIDHSIQSSSYHWGMASVPRPPQRTVSREDDLAPKAPQGKVRLICKFGRGRPRHYHGTVCHDVLLRAS